MDERFGVARSQLGDDPPVVALLHQFLVGVLYPDDGDLFPPRLFDQGRHVRNDGVALMGLGDDALLYIDDEKRGVRPVFESGQDLPLRTRSCCPHAR
ncbi:hypothetical protein SGFS_053810 [Streptomyces graminofaciens]|uniref:Uncharacterized protein n=1 Tax=Streptomyces graminofaciens TaxID=68212 RepID=A0ABM7FDC5_9ACTN|nr:hypothetical protein SGFS_053810 [Streptomyces graminofaciens]